MKATGRQIWVLAGAIVAIAAFPVAGLAAKGNGGGGGGGPGSGGGGSGGTVSMVPLYTHSGAPVYNDEVTFSVTTSATKPYVRLRCYQSSVLVYELTHGFFPGYPWAQVYRLASTPWTGGSASCRADMITYSNNKTNILSTTTFTVSA